MVRGSGTGTQTTTRVGTTFPEAQRMMKSTPFISASSCLITAYSPVELLLSIVLLSECCPISNMNDACPRRTFSATGECTHEVDKCPGDRCGKRGASTTSVNTTILARGDVGSELDVSPLWRAGSAHTLQAYTQSGGRMTCIRGGDTDRLEQLVDVPFLPCRHHHHPENLGQLT